MSTLKVSNGDGTYSFIQTTGVDVNKLQDDVTDVATELTLKATFDYVNEKVLEVNAGGTVDISGKADLTYVDEKLTETVKSVNGIVPDVNGNVEVVGGGNVDTSQFAKEADFATEIATPITNLLTNGNFSSGTSSWSNLATTGNSAQNNELTFTATGENGRFFQQFSFPNGNLIYRSMQIKSTSNQLALGQTFGTLKYHSGSGQYERLSNVSADTGNKYISVVDKRKSGWDTVSIKNVIVIDLTAFFGAGNEPTADEMDAFLLANFTDGWFDDTGAIIEHVGSSSLFVENTNAKLNTYDDVIDELKAKTESSYVYITQPPYNAPADGSDISTILNQAITDTASKGLTLYIPTGTYGVSKINLKDYTRIFGAGRNKTTLKHLGSGTLFVNPTSGEVGMSVLQDFTINANANTTTIMDLPRVYMSTFNRLHMTSPGDHPNMVGMHFYDGSIKTAFYNSVYDVSISGQMGTGFKFSDNGNSNRLINCRTVLVKYPVVAEDYTDHIVVMGCAFEIFEVGVTLGSIFSQVIGNRFENNASMPDKVSVSITAPRFTQQNTIIGNMFYYDHGLKGVINDTAYEGNNFIHNNDEFIMKNIKHEPSGGWASSMNMRDNGILQAGYVDVNKRTTAPSNQVGRIAYADGTTWNPGGGEGFYGYTNAGWVKLN